MQEQTSMDVGIYYQQIKFSIADFNFEKFKGEISTQYKDTDVTLTYYRINDSELLKTLWRSVPFKIKPDFILLAEIEGIGFLRPHIDHKILTGLNFYVQSNDDITTFYSLKDNIVRQSDNHYFDVESLNVVEHFVAKEKECYLLDVANIHSVTSNGNNRKFVTWQWVNTDYKHVLGSFDDTYL